MAVYADQIKKILEEKKTGMYVGEIAKELYKQTHSVPEGINFSFLVSRIYATNRDLRAVSMYLQQAQRAPVNTEANILPFVINYRMWYFKEFTPAMKEVLKNPLLPRYIARKHTSYTKMKEIKPNQAIVALTQEKVDDRLAIEKRKQNKFQNYREVVVNSVLKQLADAGVPKDSIQVKGSMGRAKKALLTNFSDIDISLRFGTKIDQEKLAEIRNDVNRRFKVGLHIGAPHAVPSGTSKARQSRQSR